MKSILSMNNGMKQEFYIYFDEYNELNCVNTYKHHYRHYKGKDACQKLDFIDFINFNKVIFKPDRIKFVNEDNIVIIEGVKQFYKQKYDGHMQRTHHRLSNHVRYRLFKKNYFDGNIKNLIIFDSEYKVKMAIKYGAVVLMSAAIIACTSHVMHKIKEMEFATDRIIYDDSLLDEGGRDYSINYKYEQQTFEIKQIEDTNYEEFDGYNDGTSFAYDNYYDIIKEEAERYGVDPHLIMAMLIQESHGKGNNIMQISYSSWNGGRIKLYDFIDNRYVNILFTNNKSLENENTICISAEDFREPEMNVKMACAIYRHSTDRMNDHILAGLQNYNFGDGNMDNVINHATSDLDMTKEELLADQDVLDFKNYVNFAAGGDKHYINNVLRYIKDTDSIYYKDIDDYGNIVEYHYNLNVKEKTMK